MVKRPLAVFSILVGLVMATPCGALAKEADFLDRDAANVQLLLDVDVRSVDADTAAIRMSSGSELFPGSASSGSIVQAPTQDNSKFVTVIDNGITTELTDVSKQEWFAPYVRDMAERGVVSGYRTMDGKPIGIFGPERPVSMEELAKMALMAAGKDVSPCGAQQPKNPQAHDRWSAPFISCAEHLEFALYADATVDITRPATRAEVVMTVLQAFGVAIRESAANGQSFSDVGLAIPFSAAIYTAATDGLVVGTMNDNGTPTGRFEPSRSVNRAELCKILSIAIQLYH